MASPAHTPSPKKLKVSHELDCLAVIKHTEEDSMIPGGLYGTCGVCDQPIKSWQVGGGKNEGKWFLKCPAEYVL